MPEFEEVVALPEMPEERLRHRRSRNRRRQVEADVLNTSFFHDLPSGAVWPSFVWSLVLSVLSVANPFLSALATNSQSQTLYAGFAMQSGQQPYGQFFGTSGIIYYTLSYLGTFFGTTIGLAVLQFVALLVAGLYFDKIVRYFSRERSIATQMTTWFYLFILALGFGGLYASIFALPFVMSSLWFLIAYMENAVRDEGFIGYGLAGAVTFLIDPKSGVLWLVATLVLTGFNIAHGKKARGVYQLLAALFGFLAVMYSVGYYTFVKQTLGLAINQTFVYYLKGHLLRGDILWDSAIILGVLLASGCLKNAGETLLSLGQRPLRALKWLLLLSFMALVALMVIDISFEWSHLIAVLPYGLLMGVTHFQTGEAMQDSVDEDGYDYDIEEDEDEDFHYAKRHAFLPVLLCVAIAVQPLFYFFYEQELSQERTHLAQIIQQETDKNEVIYAWDNNAQVYLDSERLSAASVITPIPYTERQEISANLLFELNKQTASFIVVNQNLPLPDTMKAILEAGYTKVDTNGHHLTLYKKNN